MCTIYWEFICFVLFFGQISIRVHCIYAFFFFRSCNMTFLSIKDFVLFLSGFCMSPIVLLSYQSIVICYNKSRNNQTLTSFQFQWHMSALRLVTLQKKLMVKKYTWSLAVVLKSCTD